MNELIEKLKYKLKGELPGSIAQNQMASYKRKTELNSLTPKSPKVSAVLMALYSQNNELYLPLIHRVDNSSVHGGQMGLPGGRKEEADSSLIHTALRETEEEIGVTVSEDQVLGSLSNLYIPPSNSLVTPVVAYIGEKPSYQIQPSEVQRVIDISVNELLKPENMEEIEVTVMNDIKIQTPAFMVSQPVVWGATAMMLSEFLVIIKSL